MTVNEPPSEIEAALHALFEEDDTGLFDTPVKPRRPTSDDRLERAFIEILQFCDDHGREPSPDCREISERKLGARLVGIRGDEGKREKLLPLDDQGLLTIDTPESVAELLTEDNELAAILNADGDDIFDTSALPRRQAETPLSKAERQKAEDFEQFRPLFERTQQELREGSAIPCEFSGENSIRAGKFYLLRGMLCFVAEVYEPDETTSFDSNGKPRRRLRVIFDNGTESAMYLSSLAVRIYEEDGKAIGRKELPELELGADDFSSGYIYVLRSLSTDPEVASLDNLHKIGFTTSSVEQRIAGAEHSSTYLNAPVEVVATYRTYNLRPASLEHLIHRVFAATRLTAQARTNGDTEQGWVDATEWFIAPIEAIDDAITKIISGEIVDYVYDKHLQQLRKID